MSRVIFLLPATILLTILALLAAGLQSSGAGQLQGGIAPDFVFTQFDGKQFRLSSLRGQVVVLNIWASWCVPCRDEAPILESAWRSYRSQGVVILGADYVDTEPAAQAFIKEFGITYPNGPDLGSSIYRMFRARGVPETYFIDRHGQIARVVVGAVSESVLLATLDQLVGQAVP